MSKTNFSNEQISAIEVDGNAIISAGAGSGKTTVLTERVRRRILGIVEGKEKVTLNELLILTFTKDAASSMKDKIKEALSQDDALKNLVPYVDSADIETFDAYVKFIVTKYGYKLNMPRNINLIEDDILSIKISNLIKEIIDELYIKNDETFKEFVFLYVMKNDNGLQQFAKSVYLNILSKQKDPIEFLNNYKKEVLTVDFFKRLKLNIEQDFLKVKEKILILLDTLVNKKIKDTIIDNLSEILNATDVYNAINVNIKKIEPSKIQTANGDYPGSVDDYKIIDEISNLCSFFIDMKAFDFEAYENHDIDNNIKYISYLIDNLFIPLINRVNAFKEDKGFYTFSDIAKMAIKLVQEVKEVRDELKNKYKLIMIDEYQDTSDEQEEFINTIANNNVFCVGDIKQSIYRFRGARPDLFKEKYELYSNCPNIGKAINMNKNFRSRKEIINPINDLFSTLMTFEFGGANYKKDHIIEAANKCYDEFGTPNNLCTKNSFGFSEIYGTDQLSDNLLETKFKSASDRKVASQAIAIALDIKKRVEGGFKVFDFKNKCLRKATYKDFSILTYRQVKFDIFKIVFKEFNIPLNARSRKDLNESLSTTIIANVFKFIYLLNKNNRTLEDEDKIRHLFISIARSNLFELDDSKIYELIIDKTYKNSDIYKFFLDLTKKYKGEPLSTIYLSIFKDLNYVSKAYKLPDVIDIFDDADVLYSKIKTMDLLGYDLNDLSEYFDDLGEFKIKIEEPTFSEVTDAVEITTVHKSKGLEYPVVYMPDLRGFADSEKKQNDYSNGYFIKDNYFFLPLLSNPVNVFSTTKKSKLFSYALVNEDSLIEDKAERLRLFYVALTRAKENLIFVYNEKAPISYSEKLDEVESIIKENLIENRVSFKDEEVKSMALKRIKAVDSINFGKDFESFLMSSHFSLPISEYYDVELNDLEKTIKGKNIELTDEHKNVLRKALLSEYKEANFSFENFKKNPKIIFEFIKGKKENIINKGINVLFSGSKIIGDYILKCVTIEKESKKDSYLLVAYFSPFIKLKAKIDYLSEANEIAHDVVNRNFDSLIELLNLKTHRDKYLNISKFDEKHDPCSKLEIRNINIKPIPKKGYIKASKDLEVDASMDAIHFGTHLHLLLEIMDFKNPNYDYIKDERERNIIKKVVNLLDEVNIKDADIYKEYQFDDPSDGVTGVIDLLLIYEDKAIIIDYKLKNLDEENYPKQLGLYKKYVMKAFGMSQVETYLLSILNGELNKID